MPPEKNKVEKIKAETPKNSDWIVDALPPRGLILLFALPQLVRRCCFARELRRVWICAELCEQFCRSDGFAENGAAA